MKRAGEKRDVRPFQALSDGAKETARRALRDEMKRLPWREPVIGRWLAEAEETGIVIARKSVLWAKDTVSFTAERVALPAVLDRSGIGKRFLSGPGHYALFLAHTEASIRRIRPFSADVRTVCVSVALAPFDNNDGERAAAACDLAAGLLERYLRRLVVTLAIRLKSALAAEYKRLMSGEAIEACLIAMGSVFYADGTIGNGEEHGDGSE